MFKIAIIFILAVIGVILINADTQEDETFYDSPLYIPFVGILLMIIGLMIVK